jgi:hypothetical protein
LQIVDPGVTNEYVSPNLLSRLIIFLKHHPLLFLILLTPGIPEYLSSSSSLTLLVLNPLLALLLLGANVGLYGSGVILIREAIIRWNKGYATVVMLGMGYAIVEEGLALRTLYNPVSPVVGNLGIYGHWIGVNWVWTAGLLIFHSIYSIALPIFLFGLVFPQLRRTSLVSANRLSICILTLTLDSIFLTFIANYNPGIGILLFSGLAVACFVLLGKGLPQSILRTSMEGPKRNPRTFGLLGALLFPATLLTGSIAASTNISPFIPIVLDFTFMFLILTKVYRSLGNQNNQEHKTAFAIGLLIPVVIFGILASFGIGNFLIIAGDILFVLFSRRLWKKWHYWTMLQRFNPQPASFPSFGPS